MNKCMQCLLETSNLKESELDEGKLLCEECSNDEYHDIQEYLEDMYYACLNGCCKCCGCSCY